MLTRRAYLKLSLAAGVSLGMGARLLADDTRSLSLITREVPAAGKRLPVVGLGSSATCPRSSAS